MKLLTILMMLFLSSMANGSDIAYYELGSGNKRSCATTEDVYGEVTLPDYKVSLQTLSYSKACYAPENGKVSKISTDEVVFENNEESGFEVEVWYSIAPNTDACAGIIYDEELRLDKKIKLKKGETTRSLSLFADEDTELTYANSRVLCIKLALPN